MDPSVPGAASVHSLVVLWEAEKGVYPAGARSFMTVVATFTRDLGKALKGMEPPYSGGKSAIGKVDCNWGWVSVAPHPFLLEDRESTP